MDYLNVNKYFEDASSFCRHGYPKGMCQVCKIDAELEETRKKIEYLKSKMYLTSIPKCDDVLMFSDVIKEGDYEKNSDPRTDI